jgi:hypothetical protein
MSIHWLKWMMSSDYYFFSGFVFRAHCEVPMLKNELKEKKCIWCREPIEDESRKFFCNDDHEAEWIRRTKRQAELDEDHDPGIGFGG